MLGSFQFNFIDIELCNSYDYATYYIIPVISKFQFGLVYLGIVSYKNARTLVWCRKKKTGLCNIQDLNPCRTQNHKLPTSCQQSNLKLNHDLDIFSIPSMGFSCPCFVHPNTYPNREIRYSPFNFPFYLLLNGRFWEFNRTAIEKLSANEPNAV